MNFPALFERVEDFHNRASDTAFVWFPFVFLRPLPSQPLSLARRLVMTVLFGSYFGVMLSLRNAIFGGEKFLSSLLSDVLLSSGIFLIWFNGVTGPLWNRRARRLSGYKQEA